MIKELNDLVHFLKTSVWRDEELLAFFSRGDANALNLYRTAWNHTLTSDAAAAKAAGMSLAAYKPTARKLRRHLREMTVFFDAEKAKADAALLNFTDGALDMAILQALHARGYRSAPLEIAKRLLRRGVDYDMPVFAVEALRVLKEAVLSVEGNAGQFEDYSRRYWEYRAYVEVEERAADQYQWLKLAGSPASETGNSWLEKARESLQLLEPHKGKVPSALFHLYFYSILGDYHLETFDGEGALRCYEEAIAWFEARLYPADAYLARFHYYKVPACIMLGEYETGEAAVLASLDHAAEGSFLFFKAYEMYFYLAMHTGYYEQALDVFQTAFLHKRFSALRASQREIWHILGAWLYILYTLNAWNLPEKMLPTYKSYRFSNEVSAFSRDKSGRHTASLLAHAMLLLLEGREDDFGDRLQALGKYADRYLRPGRNDRALVFLRILGVLPKARFNPDTFHEKTRPLVEQLMAIPRPPANRAYVPELIPFEALTTFLEAYLRRKGNRSPVVFRKPVKKKSG